MLGSGSSRAGNISSYYAKRDNSRPIRISDHSLPVTGKREFMTEVNGGGSAFAAEIIIDGAISSTRLRRLIVLAEAGRLA